MIVIALALLTLLTTTAVAQPSPPPIGTDATSQTIPSGPHPELSRWWQSIGWGVLLLIILAASASAIVIFSRRYEKYLRSESGQPTPSDDVWAMHKLTNWEAPDYATDEDENTDSSPDAE